MVHEVSARKHDVRALRKVEHEVSSWTDMADGHYGILTWRTWRINGCGRLHDELMTEAYQSMRCLYILVGGRSLG